MNTDYSGMIILSAPAANLRLLCIELDMPRRTAFGDEMLASRKQSALPTAPARSSVGQAAASETHSDSIPGVWPCWGGGSLTRTQGELGGPPDKGLFTL